MLLPLLALMYASSPSTPSNGVALWRGAHLYGASVSATYQDVEDTVLDRDAPDANHGGDYTLLVGDGRTLLLRFGDLNNAVPPNTKVVDATLTLTTTGSEAPTLSSIGTVNEAWGEGPFKTIGNALKPGAEPPRVRSDLFAATWKQRFSGAGWLAAGATGSDVSAIAAAKQASDGVRSSISGLGAAVNAMLADPSHNFGFALQFSKDGEFCSSESSVGKPVLVLTLAMADSVGAPGVSVESIVPVAGGFVATITNHGATKASDLRAEWFTDGGPSTGAPAPIDIDAGTTRTVKVDASVRTNGADHRIGSIGLRLTGVPVQPGQTLTVNPAAIPISALVTAEVMAEMGSVRSARGVGLANWLQAQIDFINDTVLARSRYSFAADGCRERVRLAEIKRVGPLVDGPAPIGIGVEVASNPSGHPYLEVDFMRRLLIAIGAPDLGKETFPVKSPKVHVPGFDVGGGTPYPDLTGGGDTRYDGGLARQLILSQVPIVDSVNTAAGVEATGLLSATAVGELNAIIGVPIPNRRTAALNELSTIPSTVLATAADVSSVPLKNANLTFFQSREGIVDDKPAFTLPTGDSGSVLMPKRQVPESPLKNFVGSRDVIGDGTFLVHAVSAGGSGWAWLRAWQLVEARYRGDTDFASLPLNFFFAGVEADRAHNRAASRIVTDSKGSLPAKLAGLVDGVGMTNVELPQRTGDWVEIDLNRDWSLSELKLTCKGGSPWPKFSIKVYQTGQSPANAIEWFTETNWKWSVENRGKVDADGRAEVRYRGQPVQIRYIRIICLEPGGIGLSQVEAYSPSSGG